MKYANINIEDSDNVFKYIIEYDQHSGLTSSINGGRSIDGSYILYGDNFDHVRVENEWVLTPELKETVNKYNLSTIRVYLPQHSVDTYKDNVKYAVDLYIWINGRKIILGSYIFSRLDAIACPIKKFIDENYYEYIKFNILDPWEILYSNDWSEFRKSIIDSDGYEANSTGASLYISLHPVEYNTIEYVKMIGYDGGYNVIDISKYDSDLLKLHIYHDIFTKPMDKPYIYCDLVFNNVYGGNLIEYLKETYNIDENVICSYEWVVKDDENIYKGPIIDEFNPKTKMMNKSSLYLTFDNWLGWEEGMVVVCYFSVKTEQEEILYIKSNEIPLTQNLFSYLVGNNNIYNVKLNEIDMNLYNINAVNKTETTVVQIDRPEDSKSNIVQPIFFKSHDISNIVIHPAITEYISINLDLFKSHVDTFMIKIEGCTFPEVGRTNAGVLFKIVGNKLPNQISTGTYYILNQDAESVTTGKYKYDI
jgi:hypothetical protein